MDGSGQCSMERGKRRNSMAAPDYLEYGNILRSTVFGQSENVTMTVGRNLHGKFPGE